MAGRKKLKRPLGRRCFEIEFVQKQRLAACEVVRDVATASGEMFGWSAMETAVDAVVRHPSASDRQILDFLRWFDSDANPMP
jgi:hypothetical protein